MLGTLRVFPVLVAGVMLLMPPSICCVLGLADCCASAHVAPEPQPGCCQHHQAKPSASTSQSADDVPVMPCDQDPGQVCACEVPPAVSVDHADLTVDTHLHNPTVVVAGNDGRLAQTVLVEPGLGPWADLSPARHARLCVWLR